MFAFTTGGQSFYFFDDPVAGTLSFTDIDMGDLDVSPAPHGRRSSRRCSATSTTASPVDAAEQRQPGRTVRTRVRRARRNVDRLTTRRRSGPSE